MNSERGTGSISTYYLDTLIYLVQESQKLLCTDYLRDIQQSSIPPEMRQQACNWIFDFCSDCETSSRTPQLACFILDSFLAKKKLNNLSVLKLVKALSVYISMKLERDDFLKIEEIQQLCVSRFSISAILTTERYMLEAINWNINAPTAAEILRHMLLAIRPDHDFFYLYARSDAYCAMCYADYSLNMYRPHIIAAASICCVLDRIKHTDFKIEWLNELSQIAGLNLDIEQVNSCAQEMITSITTYLSRSVSSDSLSTQSSETD